VLPAAVPMSLRSERRSIGLLLSSLMNGSLLYARHHNAKNPSREVRDEREHNAVLSIAQAF